MPITWPAGLPQYFDGTSFTEARQSGALRSPMDAGPAKLRRRFTAVSVNLDGTMLLEPAQAALLETFHRLTLAEGTLAFVAGPHWRATLQLEILP
jgi:hypothetical protein